MKIAVISDIHANLLALTAVLEDIEKFNPDKIFCLGDLILAGYDPNFVCEKIAKLISTNKTSKKSNLNLKSLRIGIKKLNL